MSVEGCYDTLINPKAIHIEGEAYLEFPTGFFLDASGPGSETVDNSNPLNPFLFYPVSEGVIDYKLEIYDRWGSLVFKTTEVAHGWNGYKNGQPCDQGVYVWRARGRFTNGQPYDKSGDITLLLNKSNR
jgi:gliding motility-associated-like protein